MENGRERNDLYILRERQLKSTINAAVLEKNSIDERLWHTSVKTLKHIKSLQHIIYKSIQHTCEICHIAKQNRYNFSISTSSTLNVFDLVDVDVWGHYRRPTYDKIYYFVTIVDDCSRYTWLCLIHFKCEVIIVLRDYLTLIKNQFG
ncbi:hypothetical protein RND71_012544, partial [Anisodus tanguticus]